MAWIKVLIETALHFVVCMVFKYFKNCRLDILKLRASQFPLNILISA